MPYLVSRADRVGYDTRGHKHVAGTCTLEIYIWVTDVICMVLQMSDAGLCRRHIHDLFFDIFEKTLGFLDFYDFFLLFKTIRISIENQVFFCYFWRKLNFSWILIFFARFQNLKDFNRKYIFFIFLKKTWFF